MSRSQPTSIESMKESLDKLMESVTKEKEVFEKRVKEDKRKEKKIGNEYEEKERAYFTKEESRYEYLYPSVIDPNFNSKIASKKEFYDSRYDLEVKEVETEAERICAGEFELAPHQAFVRNFLSFLTPYNSLLLFHGLGTGKTCSSISVCEEMREYMKQTGVSKKIIIIASPNVQENFQKQLFDERKLVEVNGIWNLRACTGNRLLKEINPMNMKGLPKKQVIKQIKKIIKQYYLFIGYHQFSNAVDKIKEKYKDIEDSRKKTYAIEKHLKREFSNRLIVIDEVHNIRISDDSKIKSVADNLMSIARITENLKLLLLSATPMFNSYKEIIFLLNLFNLNDGRPLVDSRDIFDKKGNFKMDKSGREIGKELFIQKITGYVSFVQGEDPYSFPYRIYPALFSPEQSSYVTPNNNRMQINDVPIVEPMNYTDCFMVPLGKYQKDAYEYLVQEIKDEFAKEDVDSKMGWSVMDKPLQMLNISYPSVSFDKLLKDEDVEDFDISELIGKTGLENTMNYDKKTKRKFNYKEGVVERYGRVFSPEHVHKYSGKLHNLVQSIKKSNGIVLVYTQFLDGGCVPIALTLEEMGITRYGTTKNLYENPPHKQVDASTLKTKEEVGKEKFNPAKYVIISGDVKLSPHNDKEITACTNVSNKYGDDVKVIIITRAGSEGIDFKFIRQVHIMEPWYNNNRNEQTIGRAVRFKSHCELPFEERNVEIYLYGTRTTDTEDFEPVDMHIYRHAEYKSIQIGKVSRTIKENAVDCILNKGNTQLSAETMNQKVSIITSTNKKLEYDVGLKPYSSGCDYMEDCNYKCNASSETGDFGKNISSYNERFIVLNVEKLIIRIKDLFKEQFTYKKTDLIKLLQAKRNYPLIQIDSALTQLVEDKTEFVTDMFNNTGHIVNIGDYYLFQPLEYNETQKISYYDRSHPVEYKHKSLQFNVAKDLDKYSRTDVALDKDIVYKGINKDMERIVNIIRNTRPELDTDESNTVGDDEEGVEELSKEQQDINYLFYLLQRVDGATFTQTMMNELLIEYYVDRLEYKNKKALLQFCVKTEFDDGSTEEIVAKYLDRILYYQKGEDSLYLLYDNMGKMKLFTLDDTKTLVSAKASLIKRMYSEIEKKVFEPIETSDINKFFSFVTTFKLGVNTMVFKVKEHSTSQDRGGATCERSPLSKVLLYLEKFLSSDIYDSLVNNKAKLIPKTKKGGRGLKKEVLCLLLELYGRVNTKQKKDGKIWYITHETGMINKLKM